MRKETKMDRCKYAERKPVMVPDLETGRLVQLYSKPDKLPLEKEFGPEGKANELLWIEDQNRKQARMMRHIKSQVREWPICPIHDKPVELEWEHGKGWWRCHECRDLRFLKELTHFSGTSVNLETGKITSSEVAVDDPLYDAKEMLKLDKEVNDTYSKSLKELYGHFGNKIRESLAVTKKDVTPDAPLITIIKDTSTDDVGVDLKQWDVTMELICKDGFKTVEDVRGSGQIYDRAFVGYDGADTLGHIKTRYLEKVGAGETAKVRLRRDIEHKLYNAIDILSVKEGRTDLRYVTVTESGVYGTKDYLFVSASYASGPPNDWAVSIENDLVVELE